MTNSAHATGAASSAAENYDQKGVAMHAMVKAVSTAAVAVALAATTATTATADPAKKSFLVHVWCPDGNGGYAETAYLTSQLGANPVWLPQGDGSTVKTGLVHAAEYNVFTAPTTPSPSDWLDPANGAVLLSEWGKPKTGFTTILPCIHFANWGTESEPFYLEGPLDLGVLPSQS